MYTLCIPENKVYMVYFTDLYKIILSMYTMYTFLHIYLNFILYDRLQDASEVTSLPHFPKVQR